MASNRVTRRGSLGFQIALQQDCGGHAIHDPFTFFPADVGGDQEIFRLFRRHPFIPGDDRNRKRLAQAGHKFMHGLDGRTLFAVEPQRQSEQHLLDVMHPHQFLDMGDIAIQRAPLERLQRLGRPPEFIAQCDADPLGTMIQCQNSTCHQFTARANVRLD